MRRFSIVGLLLLLAPGAASASTLSRSQENSNTVFTYTAAPGEANVVSVSIKNGRITLTDPGATIEATAPCSVQGGVATCPTPEFFFFQAKLGDGDDSLALPPTADGGGVVARLVDGGPGNDSIEASAVTLLGGEGDDQLTSERATARLLGGPGTDTLTGSNDFQEFTGGPGVDTIDAGPGDGQTVSFAGVTDPVIADLSAPGPMGPEGEQDMVTGADGVIGGKGNDQLTGDGKGNRLDGAAGDDLIDGGGGPDDITTGSGDDIVTAGGGRDEVRDTVKDSGTGTRLDGGGGADDIRAVGGPSFVFGGDGDDEIRLGAKVETADGGAGKDLLMGRGEFVAPDSLLCGDDDDAAENFGRTAVPADCEEISFPSTKVTLTVPNAITLDGRELTVAVPNFCLEKCKVRSDVIIADKADASVTTKLPNRRNDEATILLTAPTLRAIKKVGAVTIFYDGPTRAILGPAYVTYLLD